MTNEPQWHILNAIWGQEFAAKVRKEAAVWSVLPSPVLVLAVAIALLIKERKP